MDKIQEHQNLINYLHNLYVTKNADYGDSVHDTYEKYGLTSFLVRLEDKLNRARTLSKHTARVADEKIEGLKSEFEKRNPTQVEKLSMQTAKSYPFNVKPEEFWAEKEATSNYSTEDDQNGVKQGQYVITAKDIAGETNWKEIADSLDDDDFMYNQTLNKILSL